MATLLWCCAIDKWILLEPDSSIAPDVLAPVTTSADFQEVLNGKWDYRPTKTHYSLLLLLKWMFLSLSKQLNPLEDSGLSH